MKVKLFTSIFHGGIERRINKFIASGVKVREIKYAFSIIFYTVMVVYE